MKHDAEPTINFSSKELFLEINRKIDVLTELSHKKADRVEVEKIELAVIDLQRKSDLAIEAHSIGVRLGEDVRKLAAQTATANAVSENNTRIVAQEKTSRQQWIGILIAILVGLGNVVVALYKH